MAPGRGERATGARGGVAAGAPAGAETGARGGVAARQRELVAALVAGAEPPQGVDRDRVRVQATALLRKRGRSVAHVQPDLAAALGPGFGVAFQSYARDRTGLPPDHAADDALEFARFLLRAGGQPYVSAEVRREARRVTRPRLSRLGLLLRM